MPQVTDRPITGDVVFDLESADQQQRDQEAARVAKEILHRHIERRLARAW